MRQARGVPGTSWGEAESARAEEKRPSRALGGHPVLDEKSWNARDRRSRALTGPLRLELVTQDLRTQGTAQVDR